MPSKNSIKIYVQNGYYHIYNRGVNKQEIFNDEKDYAVFLRFLKEYLLPPSHEDLKDFKDKQPKRKPINCSDDIELFAFCLMPNHFHLFLKQKSAMGISRFMRALSTNYVMYFNRRYDRVGPLFQGVYKAVLITSESNYLHITRYIHTNPNEIINKDHSLENYQYSSYKYYISQKSPDWLNVNEILTFFRSSQKLFPTDILSYQSFVENSKPIKKSSLSNFLLD